MMRVTKLSFLFGLFLILASCFDREVFPETPQIEFADLRYVDTDAVDSLILTFNFQDENGDIGLESDEIQEPYNASFGVVDDSSFLVTIDGDFTPPFSRVPMSLVSVQYFLKDSLDSEGIQLGRFVTVQEYQAVGASEFLSNEDPRPASPSCNDFVDATFHRIVDVNPIYQDLEDVNSQLFIFQNEFHHNFHVEFLRKSNGEYTVLDFESIFNFCLDTFDGRIPVFDPDGRSGSFSYAMLSQGFRLAFQEDTIKLRFYIYDRELNQSNIEETPDFVLSDLIQ